MSRRVQAWHKIIRQERTIARRAHEPLHRGTMLRRPIKARQNAGKRTREGRHAVGNDRRAEACESPWIPIGADDDVGTGRPQPRQHPLEDGDAADLDERLVAAAHAARTPAGQDKAERCGIGRLIRGQHHVLERREERRIL